MSVEKAKVAVPTIIAALAIALALGSVNDDVIVEIGAGPTPYSADHARVQNRDTPAEEQPPTF